MKWRGPFGGGAASGKAGAMVASRAKSTQYIRARVTPVNPSSVFQQAVRAGVKALTSLWQSLTSTQRDAWNVYATNVTRTNTLGDQVKVSGQNWFVGNNTIRAQSGLPPVLDGPIVFDMGNPNWSLVNPVFTIATGGAVGTITLSTAITGGNGTQSFLSIFQSRPYSAGKFFFKGPYRLAHNIIANSSGNIPAAAYTFNAAFVASGVGSGDTQNQMEVVLRLDRGDGRLSSKFQLLSS